MYAPILCNNISASALMLSSRIKISAISHNSQRTRKFRHYSHTVQARFDATQVFIRRSSGSKSMPGVTWVVLEKACASSQQCFCAKVVAPGSIAAGVISVYTFNFVCEKWSVRIAINAIWILNVERTRFLGREEDSEPSHHTDFVGRHRDTKRRHSLRYRHREVDGHCTARHVRA